MSNTVTFDPSTGESIVETSGGRNIGHQGIYAGEHDQVTGEWREDIIQTSEFVGREDEVYSPEERIQARLGQTPMTDANSTDADVIAWLKTPGTLSHSEVAEIIEGWDANDVPDHMRDQMMSLLAFKEGSLSFEELDPELQVLFGAELSEASNYFQEEEEGASTLESLAQELGVEQAVERLDESSREDLETVFEDINQVVADESVVDEQQELANSLHESGDYNGAFIAMLSANYHAGHMSREEAIKEAVSKLGMKNAIDAFTRLSYGYSATGNETTYGRNPNNY